MNSPLLTLRVTLPSGQVLELRPSGPRQVLGRGRDCPLLLADPAVSRRHARVCLEEEGWFIEDLGSANGTLLNGQKITRARLAPGDSLQMGGCRMEVSISAPAAAGEATVVAAAPKGGAPPRRRPPKGGGGKNKLVLAGVIAVAAMLVLIIVVSILGGRKKKKASPPASSPPAVSSSRPAPPPAKAPAGTTLPPSPTAPATPGGGKLSPALQAKVDALMEQARIYYEAGRWQDALAQWRQVLILDPSQALARRRLERVQNQINRKAQQALARGLQNYKYLKYQAAIQDWLQVLYLVPDPNNPVHKKAQEYIQQARSKLSR